MSDTQERTKAPGARRIAILAVHGVIPQQRYAFQDQVATALRDRLNAADGLPTTGQRPAGRRGAGSEARSAFRAKTPAGWEMDVVFPQVTLPEESTENWVKADPVAVERPSIIRIHREPAEGGEPYDVYEVIEAYWSPIDKGKTNFASVLNWLVQTVFQPANTTARYTGWTVKALSDVRYVLMYGCFGLASLSVFAIEFGFALNAVRALAASAATTERSHWWTPLAGVFDWLKGVADVSTWGQSLEVWFRAGTGALGEIPSAYTFGTLSKVVAPTTLAPLAVGALGAFLIVQGARAWISVMRQRAALSHVAIQLWSRRVFVVALFVSGALLAYSCAAWVLPNNGRQLGGISLALIAAAFGFEGLRSFLTNFVTLFFGDVQIYCTRDENSQFFTLRAQILDLVERRLIETLRGGYDRVYVFAHSLGSTISLDAIMRIYNLEKEDLLEKECRQRLRGFVTFGTALEKTRYFLDAYGTSLSASLEEWQGDYYGVLFTGDRSALDLPNDRGPGIYWANFWYFNDFIADRIASYRSFMSPGDAISDSSRVRRDIRASLTDPASVAVGKIVASNRVDFRPQAAPWHVLHGDYLSADWFWDRAAPLQWPWWSPKPTYADQAIGALDIVRSQDSAVVRPAARSVRDRFERFGSRQASRENIVDVLPPPVP